VTYYDNQDFTGHSISRIDPQVNFSWNTGSPDSAIGVDSFSARWVGQVQAQRSEIYTFHATADDGVRLWVDGQLLIDQWKNQGPTEYSGSIGLTAGQKYDITLEYYEFSSGATHSVELEQCLNGQANYSAIAAVWRSSSCSNTDAGADTGAHTDTGSNTRPNSGASCSCHTHLSGGWRRV
jgi:hypothetical protein